MADIDRYLEAATRDHTRRSYQSAIRHFEREWGGFLPASADNIAQYLAEHAQTLSINTLRQRLAAIAQWHISQGFPDPTRAPHVRKVLKGIQALHPAQERRAKPLQLAQLEQLVAWLDAQIAADSAAGNVHPLQVHARNKALVLITEGVRGEGGILRNKDGERFMERYAPTLKDLAPRDFVSRSMDQEIKEGRGCGPNGDYVLLDLTHVGAETIMKRLPSIREIGLKFANVDAIKEPIPVVPTIHYQMGGIPTNYHGQVVVPKNGSPNEVVNGFYAIGECSCVSVHGANRLGTNSLLDLVVFGRSAGNHIIAQNLKNREHKPLPADAADFALSRLAKLDSSSSGEYAQDVANDIRRNMQSHAGVFRTQALMDEGVQRIMEVAERSANIHLKDKSKVFNTARVEALEVANLVEVAKATMVSAAARKESRGAHAHSDFPNRDDENWMKHTLYYSEGNRLEYKPVTMKPLTVESVPPKARTF